VLSDLQTKLEKYERKAAQYESAAQQATSKADHDFYHGLACYCDDLAAKFREVIAKRTGTSLAAE
jgi:phage shock protein A